jgi:hypothetical protein
MLQPGCAAIEVARSENEVIRYSHYVLGFRWTWPGERPAGL